MFEKRCLFEECRRETHSEGLGRDPDRRIALKNSGKKRKPAFLKNSGVQFFYIFMYKIISPAFFKKRSKTAILRSFLGDLWREKRRKSALLLDFRRFRCFFDAPKKIFIFYIKMEFCSTFLLKNHYIVDDGVEHFAE